MKHTKQNDAKRRKLEKNDEHQRGSKSTNKSDGKKYTPQKKKSNTKFERDDTKFGSGGRTKTNVDKSNSSEATNKKKLKKTKPKKTKGKKKSHRNKNK